MVEQACLNLRRKYLSLNGKARVSINAMIERGTSCITDASHFWLASTNTLLSP